MDRLLLMPAFFFYQVAYGYWSRIIWAISGRALYNVSAWWLLKISPGKRIGRLSSINNPGKPAKEIVSGSYTGDDATAIRQITTGFKCSKIVIIPAGEPIKLGISIPDQIIHTTATAIAEAAPATYIVLHATDGFSVSGSGLHNFNDATIVYYYWAISEG